MIYIISAIVFAVLSAAVVFVMAKETNRRLKNQQIDEDEINTEKPYKATWLSGICMVLLAAVSAWCAFSVSQYPGIALFSVIKLGLSYMALLGAAVIDLKTKTIPNAIPLFLIVTRVLIIVLEFLFTNDAMSYFIGSLVGGFLCFLVLAIANKLSKGGIGGGDIKLLTAMGFMCGLSEVLSTTLLAMLLCIVVSGVLLLLKKLTTKGLLPFGPFIYAGFVLMCLLLVY